MNNPLLSICIPTYNRAACLARILDNLALLLPKDGSVEVVVSDNGSTDNSREVLTKAEKQIPYFRWFSFSENVGFALNIKHVTQLARGEYCLWAGDDDVFIDGALSYYVEELRKHPDYDWFAINFYEAPQPDLKDGPVWEPEYCREMPWKLRLPQASYRTFSEWEKIIEIPCGNDVEFFFAIFACIFRRAPAVKALSMMDANRCRGPANADEGWEYTEEAYYPHTFVWIEALRGRPGAVLPEPFYVQGIGTTRGDDSGTVSFADTTMPNIWMWVYPQLWRHISTCCALSNAQRQRLFQRLSYPTIKQLQDRGLKKKRMFVSKIQGGAYLWSIRTTLMRYPWETIKFIKNLLPAECIRSVTSAKLLVDRLIYQRKCGI